MAVEGHKRSKKMAIKKVTSVAHNKHEDESRSRDFLTDNKTAVLGEINGSGSPGRFISSPQRAAERESLSGTGPIAYVPFFK